MVTYGDCNIAEDAAVDADTETLLHTITINVAGRIKFIRIAFANVVDAKASSGFAELKLNKHHGPYRFPYGLNGGGATNTSGRDAISIPVDIPVLADEKVEVYITPTEALVNAHGGIVWEAPDQS